MGKALVVLTSFLCWSPPLLTHLYPFIILSCCLELVRLRARSGNHFFLQLSATNVSARITMKGAANCDKHCELQISVNQ